MSISYVQSAVGQATSVKNLTVNISSTGAGNLLLLTSVSTGNTTQPMQYSDSGSDSFNSNVVVRSDGTINASICMGYAYNIKSGSTNATVRYIPVTNITVLAAEYSGERTTTDPLVGTNSGDNSTVTSGNVTNNTSGSLFFGMVASPSDIPFTAEGGWNDRQNGSNNTQCSYDVEDLISSGTEAATWTNTSGNTCICIIATFAPQQITLDEDEGMEYSFTRSW